MSEIENKSEIERQAKLFQALSKAQAEFPEIQKASEVTVQMKSGRTYNFKYAELPDIIKATRPALTKHGLALCSTFQEDSSGLFLCTALLHQEGGRMVSTVKIPPTPGPQELGSMVTYMRRYQYSLLIGVAPEDDHDANNVSTTKTESFTRPQGSPQQAQSRPTQPQPSPGGDQPATLKQIEFIKKLAGDLKLQPPNAKTSKEATAAIEFLTKEKANRMGNNRPTSSLIDPLNAENIPW
jgi:hypothetical protein